MISLSSESKNNILKLVTQLICVCVCKSLMIKNEMTPTEKNLVVGAIMILAVFYAMPILFLVDQLYWTNRKTDQSKKLEEVVSK